MEELKWIFKYVRGTIDLTLYFKKLNLGLHGYVDTDMAGDVDGKSTIRYAYMLGGMTMNWVLKLQKMVVLSTIEVEYVMVMVKKSRKKMTWL